jgi:hypothetical protein
VARVVFYGLFFSPHGGPALDCGHKTKKKRGKAPALDVSFKNR